MRNVVPPGPTVQDDLDAAAAEGMTQERADAALERVTTWLENSGEVGGFRGGHHRFGAWGDGNDDEEDAEGTGA
jgi:hypothetical protein